MPSTTVSLTLSAEEYQRLHYLAEFLNRSVNEVLSEVLQMALGLAPDVLLNVLQSERRPVSLEEALRAFEDALLARAAEEGRAWYLQEEAREWRLLDAEPFWEWDEKGEFRRAQ